MPGAIVGGSNRYPSLQQIADLFRSQVNDDASGATGTPGEGNIATNTSPFLLSFMNAAIRDLYSDLRNVGDPALILDNYIILNIPPLTQPDPTVQVSLSYAGYYNGFTWDPTKILPIGFERAERMWERQNGSNAGFTEMTPSPYGLPPVNQGSTMRCWEMRQNAIWMPGALLPVDLRIRARITLPDFLNPQTLNFAVSYVPILDSMNAVVDKMCVRYARRFAPDLYQMAADAADKSMNRLRTEIVRQAQNAEVTRQPFGVEATGTLDWFTSL